MATKTFWSTKDSSVIWSGIEGWSGYDDHHPVGRSASNAYSGRSFVYFPLSFAGMISIVSATLVLYSHTAAPYHAHFTSGSTSLLVNRVLNDWGEGTDRGESVWSTNEAWNIDNMGGRYANTPQGSKVFNTTVADGTANNIDVTEIVRQWFTGTPNYGFMLRNSNDLSPSVGLEFYSRHVSGRIPALIIEYTTNTAPNPPVGLQPASDLVVTSLTPTLTGARSDPDAGDYITAFQIQVFEDNGTTMKWDSETITTTGTPTTFSRAYGGPPLTGNTYYKWRARTRDKGAIWSGWSATTASTLARFKANSAPTAPILSLSETPSSDLNTLTPTLNVTHVDADPSDDEMHGYRVILQKADGTPVWDSDNISISSAPVSTLSIPYAGPALTWGTSYRWYARTRDSNNVWGPFNTVMSTFTTHKTGKPINLDPSLSETIGGRRPVFTASRASSGDIIESFQIYVYASNGTTVIHDSGILTTGITGSSSISYTYPTDLAYGTQYKWKIAFNLGTGDFGGPSEFTDQETFQTVQDATIATQVAPVGAGILSVTPTFTGTRTSSPFTFYEIEVYNQDGTLKHDTGVISVASTNSYSYVYNGPALAWATQYRWRVSVNGSPFSGLTTFITDAARPPILISPTENRLVIAPESYQHENYIRGLPGAVALYRLNDKDGVARDLIGRRHGVYGGTYTQGQSGPIGDGATATLFSEGAYAAVSDITALELGNVFTVSAWFAFGTVGTPNSGYLVHMGGTGGFTLFFATDYKVYAQKSGVGNTAVTNQSFNTSGWHHITYTHSATAQKLYVNGTEAATYFADQVYANTGAAKYMGLNFEGKVANVGFFNRPLTADEVLRLYQSSVETDIFFGKTTDDANYSHINLRVADTDGNIVHDTGWIDPPDRSVFSQPYSGPALDGGQDYRWDARIRKTTGQESGFSPQASFHLNAPPSVPTNLFPTPGYTISSTTNPTFKATFADDDKYRGDFPKQWVITIRNVATDALIQTKTITTGLNANENVYVWNSDAADVDLVYGVDYKWSTYFVDSHGVAGQASGYSVFRAGQPPVGTLTSPSGSEALPSVVANATPTITWNYSDPNGYPQNKFIIRITRLSTGVRVYYAEVVSRNRAFKVPIGYLVRDETYAVDLYVVSTQGLIDADGDTRYMKVVANAPNAITVLNTYIDESQSKIVLRWENPPVKAGQVILNSIIYRRPVGDSEWYILHYARAGRTSATDWYAGQGVSYEYKVTQMSQTTDGSNLESPDSPEIQARLESDVWMMVGIDRSEDHIFELPVSDETHTRPVQQEAFEPLGTDRKIISRGAVLGYEGNITCVWTQEESYLARRQIDYMVETPGPHILKNPFGDVYDVQFGSPDYQYAGGGSLTISLPFIEVGQKTSGEVETF